MTRARELADLSTPNVFTVDESYNVGIGTTVPDAKVDVVGIVSATEFYGDGSNLSGITGGATLSAGSGAQRVVVTSLTSGSMTAAATDGDLSWDSSSNTLSATNVIGALTGNASGSSGSCTGNAATATLATNATNASGLSGTPNITVGTVVGSALTVSGITTVTNFDTQGTLVEAFKTHTTAWNSAGNLNLSEGNLHYNSTNLGGTGAYLNLISTAGINTDLAVGQALNVTAITAVNATTAFVNALRIDGKGTGITTSWVGGSVPAAGGGSAYDTYSFNILKTASETYIVIANQVKTSA